MSLGLEGTAGGRRGNSIRRVLATASARVLALVLLSASMALAGCEQEARGLPAAIGDVRLQEEVAGAEAAAVINRLHGKGVTPKENRIGTYAGPEGGATLYFSAYGGEDEARGVFEHMDGGIAAGHPVFGHHQSIEISGEPVSLCLGEGQAHFYFRRGGAVYWLAVDAPIAMATAEALVRHLDAGRNR